MGQGRIHKRDCEICTFKNEGETKRGGWGKCESLLDLVMPDQVLSLWSGSTDSKTLDYQRTNPREYQIVRTHTKEVT